MASPINVGFTIGVGQNKAIPLNRWARSDYSVQVETGGTLLIEGTLTQLNRADPETKALPTPVWATLDDSEGNPLMTAGVGIHKIDFTPLTAIRVTAATADVTGRLMQQGEVS